jgi:hypothetical protein
VNADRVRGAVLYAGAVVLLVAGGVWWVRAAPRQLVDPAVAQWTATAERLLPEPDEAEADKTVELGAGVDREITVQVDDGSHHIEVVCVGGPNSLVRVSLGTYNDSGRGLACTGHQQPMSFDVGVAGGLRMNLSVGGASAVVVRYAVTKGTD